MKNSPTLPDHFLYYEKLSSNKTEAIFLSLMPLFLLIFIWRLQTVSLDWLAGIVWIARRRVLTHFVSINR